jgi:hypothetical protein
MLHEGAVGGGNDQKYRTGPAEQFDRQRADQLRHRPRQPLPALCARPPSGHLHEAHEPVGRAAQDQAGNEENQRRLRHRLCQLEQIVEAEHPLEAGDRVQPVERGFQLFGGDQRADLQEFGGKADDGGRHQDQEADAEQNQQRCLAEHRQRCRKGCCRRQPDAFLHQRGDAVPRRPGREQQQQQPHEHADRRRDVGRTGDIAFAPRIAQTLGRRLFGLVTAVIVVGHRCSTRSSPAGRGAGVPAAFARGIAAKSGAGAAPGGFSANGTRRQWRLGRTGRRFVCGRAPLSRRRGAGQEPVSACAEPHPGSADHDCNKSVIVPSIT